jgi:hypothetical protein
MSACTAAAFMVTLLHTEGIWFGITVAADMMFGLIASVR